MAPSEFINEFEMARRGLVGHVCPWCQQARVTFRGGRNDLGSWSHLHDLKHEPKWRCYTCVIEITSCCESDDFDDHPDLPLVERAAKIEQMPVHNFRELLLRQFIVDIQASTHLDEKDRAAKVLVAQRALRQCGLDDI